MILTTLTILLLFASCSHGSNILAILPTPSYSHQIAYTHIWKELSLRGHKVTVITTNPLKDPKLTNLTEIDMKGSYKALTLIGPELQDSVTMWSIHNVLEDLGTQVAEFQLSQSEVQSLIHNKSHFDVVLVEYLYAEYLAFAEIFNCPKILFSSLDVNAYMHDLYGNPISPSIYPELGATFYKPMDFKERIISVLYTWYTTFIYYPRNSATKNRILREYFNTSKTVQELLADVDLLFINTNPILQPIRAVGPSTITIGDRREATFSKPLPEDIAEFLNSANDGFVYFSLGSNVKSKDLTPENMKAITETLRELPYKVLWKFEADKLPNKPENVKLIKWAPQQSVLSHPNIKLFITQGGVQSMEEAFYSEVPLVVIPFFGDQEYNGKLMVSKGVAVVVNRKPSINKSQLKAAILEVANNPKYKNTVGKLKQLALDSPITGLEKAIWWTEYVIRNKGAKHLRNPVADTPFYQYYLIDVIGFLLLLSILIFTLIYTALKTIYNLAKLYIYRHTVKPISSRKKAQ